VGEDELDEAPHEPLEWREERVQPPRERTHVVVRRQQRVAKARVRRELEGDQIEDLARDGPVGFTEKVFYFKRFAKIYAVRMGVNEEKMIKRLGAYPFSMQ